MQVILTMKRTLIIIAVMLIAGGTAYAQETMATDEDTWAGEWRHAFSPEGRKNWKTEHTLRIRAGFFTEGLMFTSGIRVDEKRTLGLFAGLEDVWDDATPANIYSARLGVTFRRYWHLGERKIFSFYSDLYAGAGYIYKVTSHETYEDKGDILFVGGWQPGVRIRCYKNLHIFLGPTLATDCIGLHLGIGF